MNELHKLLVHEWKKGIFPFIYLLLSEGIAFSFPLFPKWAIDNVVIHKNISSLSVLSIIFGILIAFSGVFSYLNAVTFFSFQKSAIFKVQERLIKRLFFYPVDFFEKMHSGYLMTRIRGDAAGLNYIFSEGIVTAFLDIIKLLAGLIILISFNIKITIISLSIIPLIVINIYCSRENIEKANIQVMETNAKTSQEITDTFRGYETYKSFATESKAIERTLSALRNHIDSELTQNKITTRFQIIVKILVHTGEMFLLYFGVTEILADRLSIGEFIAFSGYLVILYNPVKNIGTLFVYLDYAKRSWIRIKELLEIIPENTGSKKFKTLKIITFRNFAFHFNKNKTVVKNLNTSMRQGEKILIAGPSGSGKSTIIRSIMGLLRPTDGNIFYNQIPQEQIDIAFLREKISYISQESTLFNTSLRNNLTLYRKGIPERKIRETINLCKLDNTVTSLARGLDTEISENGRNFSGGEIQRISLARALLKKPDVIIIDEGTSNIDIETEEEIIKVLLKMFNGKIIIRVSHRHETINGWRTIRIA